MMIWMTRMTLAMVMLTAVAMMMIRLRTTIMMVSMMLPMMMMTLVTMMMMMMMMMMCLPCKTQPADAVTCPRLVYSWFAGNVRMDAAMML